MSNNLFVTPDNPVIVALRQDLAQVSKDMDQLAQAVQRAFQQIVAGNGKVALELEAKIVALEERMLEFESKLDAIPRPAGKQEGL